VYGALPPDLAALGLHRVAGPGGVEGWAANTLRQRFDARGNVIRRMDGLGNVGRILVDADGVFPTGVSDPLGHAFDSTYDLRTQQIVRISDPNGHETRYRFDPLARLVATIKPGDSEASPTTEVDYLETSVPVGVRTRLRAALAAATLDTVEYFDGFGRRLQLRSSAEGGTVLVDGTRRSDARGWEAFRTVPFTAGGFAYVADEGVDEPRRTSFRYDALGRIVETVTPDGRPSRIVHGLGTITRFDVSDTDDSPANVARGHFDTPRVERYDARGRLLRIEEDAGAATLATGYTFDPKGQLRSIVDPRGVEVASYAYDLLGRKIAVDHVDAGRRIAAYDARGDLALRVDAEGRRVTMRYDALRRPVEAKADGATTERYEYDAGAGSNLVGRLARVEDEAGEVRFSYTPRGLVDEKIRAVDTLAGRTELAVGNAYDSLERRTGITYPDGSLVSYEYDERGLLGSIPGIVDSFAWNPSGQLAEARVANGVVETYSFDPGSFFLAEARVDGPARPEPYYHVISDHDAVGNPIRIEDRVTVPGHRRFMREHTFDAAYRLTGMQGTLDGVAVTRAYDYDAAGNFRRNAELGPDELFLEPDGSNRIAGTVSGGVETTLFAYDANGNLTGSPGRALAFDARGRLARVTKSDGTVVDFTYGYDGERVRKRVTSGGATDEVVYVDDLVEIRDGVTTNLVSHQNRPIAAMSASGTHFSHPDHLGNVVLVTDAAGAIVRERGYFPFGTSAFSVGPEVGATGFIGREFDAETGLVFCMSRYYDPSLGRFISPDPFLLLNPERALGLPAGLNLYAYAGNNPVRLVDDTGTWSNWLIGGLIIAGLVIATIVVGVATGGAGFAFGILLAASIGSAIGAGVGTYSAWQSGGDLADGFLLGALVGGAAGAAGFAIGAAVAGAGISGVWGSILAGAAEGAVVGAGNGAIIGYAGGKGSLGDVFLQAGIGFLTGAVLGGLAGWVKYNPTAIADKVKDFAATGSSTGIDPGSGAPLFGSYSTAPGIQSAGQAAGNALQAVASATAYPVLYAGIGSTAQVLLTYHWDDIKAWILETFGGEEQQVNVPVYSS
jgi:RHS repeat-associated protein